MPTHIDPSNQVAVITGAGGGIGRELVKGFLAQGFKVAGMDLREPTLKSLADEVHSDRLLIIAMDVTKLADIARERHSLARLARLARGAGRGGGYVADHGGR